MIGKEGRLDSELCLDLPLSGETIRIAQITDTHLVDTLGCKLLGMDTDNSLAHVLKLVEQQGSFDLMLATGDIANHGSMAAYHQ